MSLLLLASTLLGATSLEVAPSFELPDLNHQVIEFSEVQGERATLLSFWATWCRPCLAELEALKEIYENYKDEGFTLVAINTDGPRSVGRVRTLVSGKQWEFPILLDTKNEVARLYGVKALPTSLLLNGQGEVVATRIGYRPGDETRLREEIDCLLESPAEED